MRKALLVGINHYKNTPLKGCIPDARRMKEMLSYHENGDRNFACDLFVSKESGSLLTEAWLKRKLQELFKNTDVALLYFSGHGDSNSSGSYLVTQEADEATLGVSFNDVITMANNSTVREIIIILDCCYSGDMGNFVGIGRQKALLREGVSILAASRDNEYAKEFKGYGVFTSIMYEALQGGAADILGNVTASKMYDYADLTLSAWKQRPVFKSHVFKMIPLRKCLPKIPFKTLRKLPTYFNDGKKGIKLSKGYIANPERKNGLIDVMSDLRKYHANGLLIPVKSDSLDEAAKRGEACILTPLGIYYRNLVLKKRI